MNILRASIFLLAVCVTIATAETARFNLATSLEPSALSAANRNALIQAAAQAAGVPTGSVALTVGPYLRLTVSGVSSATTAENAIRARLLSQPTLLQALGVDCEELLLSGTTLGSVVLPVYDSSITGHELGVLRAMRNVTRQISFVLNRNTVTLEQAIDRYFAAMVLEADTVLFTVNDCTRCLTESATATPTHTASATATRRRSPPPPSGNEPNPPPRPLPTPFETPIEPVPAPVTVPVSPPEDSDEGLSGGAIAGIVIGAVVLALLLLAGLLWWLCAPAAVAAAPVAVAKAAPFFAVPQYAVQTQVIDEFFQTVPEFAVQDQVVEEVFHAVPEYAVQDEIVDEMAEVWGAQQFTSYPGYEVATAATPAQFWSHGAAAAPLNTPVTTGGGAPWLSYDLPYANIR